MYYPWYRCLLLTYSNYAPFTSSFLYHKNEHFNPSCFFFFCNYWLSVKNKYNVGRLHIVKITLPKNMYYFFHCLSRLKQHFSLIISYNPLCAYLKAFFQLELYEIAVLMVLKISKLSWTCKLLISFCACLSSPPKKNHSENIQLSRADLWLYRGEGGKKIFSVVCYWLAERQYWI